MTRPEGQTQVIACAQSMISLIRCLFRLVKCKFTEPLYKSAWYTLLSLLIFSTYARSIKREGRNPTKKKRKYRGCCSCCIPLGLCSSIARYCGYRDSPTGGHSGGAGTAKRFRGAGTGRRSGGAGTAKHWRHWSPPWAKLGNWSIFSLAVAQSTCHTQLTLSRGAGGGAPLRAHTVHGVLPQDGRSCRLTHLD